MVHFITSSQKGKEKKSDIHAIKTQTPDGEYGVYLAAAAAAFLGAAFLGAAAFLAAGLAALVTRPALVLVRAASDFSV